MHSTLRRTLATVAVLALGAGTTACGADERAATDGASTAPAADDADVLVDSMVGLEVAAVGNVSDVLSDEAIRIDRDGLGTVEDQGEVGDDLDYDYDYDYYDYDDLTEYDDEYDDGDVADEGVLVVSAAGLQQRQVDEAVRVSGTVRRFDRDSLESLYDLNLEDDVFDDYDDSLVVVADSVKPASAPGAAGPGSGSGSKDGTQNGARSSR